MRVWRSREQEALKQGLPTGHAKLPDLIQRFLFARQITDPDSLFQTRLQEMADPFVMKGMRQAVERLVQAHERKEKVCVYADFDLDGTSGLALMWEGLEKLGFEGVIGYQPKRLSEGYGFHASAVEELAREGVKVIITVDVGITALAAAETAKSLGVDVILTDHHLPLEKLPEVYALINPNQGDCPSGLGVLCGAGVAFYLLRALKRGLLDAGRIKESDLNLKDVLDFLTIATLTDMVPLTSDNRALVKQGLIQLAATPRPGLKILLEELGLHGRQLTSQDVAVRFAPKLNALSRLETGLRPIDLFRARDFEVARQMVREVMQNNSARVELQGAGEERAVQMLQNWNQKKFVFFAHPEFHRGVVGLIATKIAGQAELPTFIGSQGADGFVVGSARTAPGSDFNLLDALGAVGTLLTRFGGHAGAAGFEFHQDNFDAIIEGLARFFEEQAGKPVTRVVDYDLDVNVADLTPGLMKWLESLGPFGQGFPAPLFHLDHVRIRDSKILRGGHRKLWLEDGSGKSVEALYFSPPPSLTDAVVARGSFVSILAELQWNDFNGQRTLQLLVRDLVPVPLSQASEATAPGPEL